MAFWSTGMKVSLIRIKRSTQSNIKTYTFSDLLWIEYKWSFEFADYSQNIIYIIAVQNNQDKSIACKFHVDNGTLENWRQLNNVATIYKFIAINDELILFSDIYDSTNERNTYILKFNFLNLANNSYIVDQFNGTVGR